MATTPAARTGSATSAWPIDAAIDCKAGILLIPECGQAYAALRWEAADLYGKPLPFKVMAVTEYLAEALQEGRLQLGAAATGPTTFQDPCKSAARAESTRRRGPS